MLESQLRLTRSKRRHLLGLVLSRLLSWLLLLAELLMGLLVGLTVQTSLLLLLLMLLLLVKFLLCCLGFMNSVVMGVLLETTQASMVSLLMSDLSLTLFLTSGTFLQLVLKTILAG